VCDRAAFNILLLTELVLDHLLVRLERAGVRSIVAALWRPKAQSGHEGCAQRWRRPPYEGLGWPNLQVSPGARAWWGHVGFIETRLFPPEDPQLEKAHPVGRADDRVPKKIDVSLTVSNMLVCCNRWVT
jgi:hypothetical protein